MRVYRGNTEIVRVVIDNMTQLKRSLLTEDFIQSGFIMDSYFDFQIGDYINWRGKKYTIFKQPSVKKVQANQFQYNIDFESDQYYFSNAIYLLDNKGDFYLNGNFQKFANLIIVNMNRIAGDGYYQLGEVPDTAVKNLNFNNYNCIYVTRYICQEFEKEFYFSGDGKTLNFTDKIGHDVNLPPFEFRSGLRNIERQKITDKNLVTRLYAFGGTRNITNEYRGSKYTGKRLKLPGHTGYIERNTDLFGIIEGVVNFDDIYPHRKGVVSSVDAENVFKFVDASMEFDLNDQLIEGVVAKMTFNTGNLAGYEFEIAQYANSSKQFTIIQYQDNNGLALPNSDLKIAIGDEYVLYDVKMPQSYVDNAEEELQKKAEAYLKENSLPNVTYSIAPDYPYLREKLIELNVGDIINIKDDEFGIEIQTRIISLTQSLANKYIYSIKVGNKVAVSYLNRVIADQLKLDNHIRIEKYDRTVQYNRIRKNLKNIDELKDAIFDPDGYFKPENIKPLSIETSMLTAGTKGQQFIIRNLLIEANYQSNADKVKCSTGVLVHFTISQDKVKKWNLTGNLFVLDKSDKPYYIYAKCLKDGNTGLFEITTTQYNTDQANYYYFLIGVVHSVVDDVRGISLTYGQTTINGKFITTGKVRSVDGYNFFDLDKGQFNLGDENSGLDWNVSEKGKLTIKGGLVQSGSGDTFPIAVYKGKYEASECYYLGDQVSYEGGTYISVSKTPHVGIKPTDTDYWAISAKPGTDGQSGHDGTGIVFRGLFSASKLYYNNPLRRDVVKYNNQYYLYKGTNSVALAWSISNWENFGAQFDSVATDLLLAENANIGDWIIKEGKIVSQKNYNGTPRAVMDGVNGVIELTAPKTIYTYSGGERTYKQTIKLDSKTGNIEASHTGDAFQESGVSIIDSKGVFANFAGTDALAPETGVTIKSAIVGLGFGKLKNEAFSDYNAIAGVVGRAYNSATDAAPAYGGLFFGLKTYGLFYNVKVIRERETIYKVSDDEDYISCYNTSHLNVYLPSTHSGRIIYVKRANNTVWVHGKILQDIPHPHVETARGDCWMFVFDGSYWCTQKLVSF